MGDPFLYCNAGKCRKVIADTAWVTRCFHVFCAEHGRIYFSSALPQVNCPACNETNTREKDIIFCDLNPSDMILAGLPPQKAINLVAKSYKLWSHQIQQEKDYWSIKLNHLNKKLSETKYMYEKMLNKLQTKFEADVSVMKKCYDELAQKLTEVTEELTISRSAALKYQAAYNSLAPEKQPPETSWNFRKSNSPEWRNLGFSLQPSPHLSDPQHNFVNDNLLDRSFRQRQLEIDNFFSNELSSRSPLDIS